MARDQVDMTPIETREELIAWFEAGSKPKVAVSHWHRAREVSSSRWRPQSGPYDGSRSIRALLEGMQHLLGWEPIIENGNIIGLFRRHERRRDLTRAWRPVSSYRGRRSRRASNVLGVDGASRAGQEIARPLGIGFLGLGMTPNWSRAEIR